MISARDLRRSDLGSTAIEYAVIGALIGIGLIGSLVGTKTSLSAIFGVASQNMASATATTAPPKPLSQAAMQRVSYWAAKGLVSRTVSGKDTVYTYGDGSTVTYTAYANTDFQDQIVALDTQTHRRETYYRLPNGDPFLASVIQYAPDNARYIASYSTNPGTSSWSNGVPQTQQTNSFDSNGSYTGQSFSSPTAQYLGYVSTVQSDIDAFASTN